MCSSSLSGPTAAGVALSGAGACVGSAVPDVWQLSDDEIIAALHGQAAAAAQAEAWRLALVRQLDVRGYARAQGSVSTASWLSQHLLLDPAAASATVRQARQLDPDGDVPTAPGVMASVPLAGEVALAATGRELVAGRISRAHADAISATVRALPLPDAGSLSPAERDDLHARAEAALLGWATSLTPADVRTCGRRLRHLVDPDGALAEERAATRAAQLWIRPDPDGGPGYRFGGHADAVTGARLITFIDAHSRPRPVLDPETGVLGPDPRTVDERRGGAFADLVVSAADADTTTAGGSSTQLVVTVPLASLTAGLGERGVPAAETENGSILSPATARLLACDASIIPAVLGSASQPLDIGRATRTISTGLRRALVLRDGHCAFPGCGRPPSWADAHHIRHWSNGGATALHNLVLLCGHHHDVIHHTGWTVSIGDDRRPVFQAPPLDSRPRQHVRRTALPRTRSSPHQAAHAPPSSVDPPLDGSSAP